MTGVVACKPGVCQRFHCAGDSEARGVAETLTGFGFVCTVLTEVAVTSGVFARVDTLVGLADEKRSV